jgi:hypothetical protein
MKRSRSWKVAIDDRQVTAPGALGEPVASLGAWHSSRDPSRTPNATSAILPLPTTALAAPMTRGNPMQRYYHSLCAVAVLGLTLAARGAAQETMAHGKMDKSHMEQLSAAWPKASKEALKFMTEKYGPPAAMTQEMASWGKTGPWKRTIVFAKEYPHEFPMHHTDVMQQWIDYKAPVDKYDELAMYDGSVVLERTSGEMSARCEKEGANFLALNLAHEIATGKRSVDDARSYYGEQVKAMMSGKPAPYMEKLMFTVPTSGTGDPDRPLATSASKY